MRPAKIHTACLIEIKMNFLCQLYITEPDDLFGVQGESSRKARPFNPVLFEEHLKMEHS